MREGEEEKRASMVSAPFSCGGLHMQANRGNGGTSCASVPLYLRTYISDRTDKLQTHRPPVERPWVVHHASSFILRSKCMNDVDLVS